MERVLIGRFEAGGQELAEAVAGLTPDYLDICFNR